MASRGLNLDHRHLVRFYNPIAAMPSHHVAFAVVTGFGLSRRARSRRARQVARLYPVVVASTVVATGNHFAGDVLAGAALGAVSRRLAGRAVRSRTG
jgi:membrane-associated phospholipid phosphatase